MGISIQNNTTHEPQTHWFAMRVVGPRVYIGVRNDLTELGIEFFQPMRTALKRTRARTVRTEVPIVGGLFFCHGIEKEILDYCRRVEYRLQFIIPRGKTISDRIIIPDNQMNRFIEAVRTHDYEYLAVDDAIKAVGKLVRIHGGALDGATGRLQAARGKRRFILLLENLMAVSITLTTEVIDVI